MPISSVNQKLSRVFALLDIVLVAQPKARSPVQSMIRWDNTPYFEATQILYRQVSLGRLQERVTWVIDTARVDRSAAIRNLAKALSTPLNSTHGAVVFSNAKRCGDASRIFMTVIYLLAVKLLSYRDYIGQELTADLKLLEKLMTAQYAEVNRRATQLSWLISSLSVLLGVLDKYVVTGLCRMMRL